MKMDLGSWDDPHPCSASGHRPRSTKNGFPRCWLYLVRLWKQVHASVLRSSRTVFHIFFVNVVSCATLMRQSTEVLEFNTFFVKADSDPHGVHTWKSEHSTCSLVSVSFGVVASPEEHRILGFFAFAVHPWHLDTARASVLVACVLRENGLQILRTCARWCFNVVSHCERAR